MLASLMIFLSFRIECILIHSLLARMKISLTLSSHTNVDVLIDLNNMVCSNVDNRFLVTRGALVAATLLFLDHDVLLVMLSLVIGFARCFFKTESVVK